MKEMDPDTPNRLLYSNSNVVERKNDVHVDGHSRISDPRHQSLDQMQNLAIASQQGRCNGASKFKIPRKTRTDNIENPNKCIIDLSSSPLPSHSDRTLTFQRVALEKPIQEKADDRSLKADRASHKPSGQQSFPKQIPDNLFPNDSKEEEKREGSLKLGCPSYYRNDTSTMCGYSSKGKEKTSELCGVPLDAGVRHDGEFWSANNSMSPCQTTVMVAPKAPTSASKLVHIVESPKRGPKRFVRNGLISPKNIARGKMITGQNSCVKDAEQNIEGSAVHIDPQALIDFYGSRAEGKGNGVSKGKSVKSHLQMTNKVDIGAQSLNDRDTVIHTEDYNEVIGAKEEVGNWIRTHSHPQNSGRPISNLRINSTASLGGSQYSEERKYETSSLNKTPEEGGELHQNGIPIPSFNGHGHSYSATESSIGTKRCRRVHSSTRQQITSQGLPNILISEPSSSRVNDSVSSNGDNMDARNWQLEADERLARELQEQLYQEDNLYRGREMDANIAMALLQDEQEEHASAAGTRPLFNSGASVAHRMLRQPRLRSSQPSSRMRGVRHRLYGRSRGARPRSGVRVSDPSNFMGSFPFDMSVDTRLDILEAWEAASDDITGLGILDNLLQTGHDFDENDYERLLALDEHNLERGATTHQINSLPLSTVQTDKCEDSCAICLENPGVGETVRHLPCFHKFHEECIDQWLGRKTWCPVCKLSITAS